MQVIDFQANGNMKKFAELTGIPYSTVVEYAKGVKKDPKLSFLVKIKNVNAEWLLTGNGDPSISAQVVQDDRVDIIANDLGKYSSRLDLVELKLDALNVLILKHAALADKAANQS